MKSTVYPEAAYSYMKVGKLAAALLDTYIIM